MIYRYVKIVKDDGQVKAEFSPRRRSGPPATFDELGLRDVLDRYDKGVFKENPDVVISEFEKGLRALMIALDGGIASLLNPGKA